MLLKQLLPIQTQQQQQNQQKHPHPHPQHQSQQLSRWLQSIMPLISLHCCSYFFSVIQIQSLLSILVSQDVIAEPYQFGHFPLLLQLVYSSTCIFSELFNIQNDFNLLCWYMSLSIKNGKQRA